MQTNIATANGTYVTTAESFRKNYSAITQPGLYNLKVRSVGPEFQNRNGQSIRIVSFYAITSEMISEELAAKLKDNQEIDVQNDLKQTVSFQIPVNQEIPGKGMHCKVQMDYVYSKGKGRNVLAPTAVTVPQARNTTASAWDTVLHGDIVSAKNVENGEGTDDSEF